MRRLSEVGDVINKGQLASVEPSSADQAIVRPASLYSAMIDTALVTRYASIASGPPSEP